MSKIVFFEEMITLIGGGAVAQRDLDDARVLAPRLVAADGGADRALAAGWVPDAVIGDLDSISDQARAELGVGRIHHIAEQDSTDFDKCLRAVSAPVMLGLGFLGDRVDHALAAMSGLCAAPEQRCILVGDADLVFLAPAALSLDLPLNSRLSLFPMGLVRGRSQGLEWPIQGLDFAPATRIGTSNRVVGPVELAFDAPRMLVIVARDALDAVVSGLLAAG